MAEKYLRADGSNTPPFSTWATAANTPQDIAASQAPGDDVYVSKSFDYDSTSLIDIDWVSSGEPIKFYGVDDTGDPEPPTQIIDATTPGSVPGVDHPRWKTTGALVDIVMNGRVSFRGMEIISNDDIILMNSTGIAHCISLTDCIIGLFGTSGADNFTVGTRTLSMLPSHFTCENTIFKFGAAGQNWIFRIVRGNILGGKIDFALDNIIDQLQFSDLFITDFDASICNNTFLRTTNNDKSTLLVTRSSVGSGINLVGVPALSGDEFKFYSIDNEVGDSMVRFREEMGDFGIITDDTSIYRIGGATDDTENWAAKMSSNGNVSVLNPMRFRMPSKGADWSTGSKKLRFEFLHDSLTPLTNNDIFVTVGTPTTDSVRDVHVTSRLVNVLGTPTNYPASSAIWNEEGSLTNPNKQYMEIDTPATLGRKGAAHVEIGLAIKNKDVWVCQQGDVI